MNKRIYWLLFFIVIFLGGINNVSAIKCSYNFSGYKDETTIWTVDSLQDKQANMETTIGTLAGAGREPVLNWDTAEIGSYKATDDINNGRCPEYLVQTYYGGYFQGYQVFLANSSSKSQIVNSDLVQKFGVFNWDRSVLVYKLMDRDKPGASAVKCSYVNPDDESYSFTLSYDDSGNLVGSENISENTWQVGFQLSYTAYDTKLSSNTCNVTAYQCYDWEIGYRRVYLNADGLLNEDESFSADSSNCTVYKFDQDTSESELGEPPSSEAACQVANEYMTELETYAKQYKSCKDGGTCTNGGSLNEFTQTEKKLDTFCNAAYQVSYYSDSCTQYCVNIDSKIAKIKAENGIDQTVVGPNQCSLSDRLVDWIFKVVTWVRYLVPIILIVMTILNFISAIAADKDDEIKKAGSKFVKRLIVAVLIFIIPLILEFLLGIFGIGTNGYCL